MHGHLEEKHERGERIVVYIEKRALIRECLGGSLSRAFGRELVLPFASIGECCTAGLRPEAVSIVLYGLDQAPGEHADLDLDLTQLKKAFPASPIMLLSDFDGEMHVLTAIKTGARGFISTNSPLDVAVGAAQVVAAGGSFIPESCLAALRPEDEAGSAAGPRERSDFTPRQIDVLKRLRQGKANRVIARELEISESRVKAHIRNLMQKLNATNRTQVAYLTKEVFVPARPAQPRSNRPASSQTR